MFAKLFSRITESSLMEESIEVRYTFMMLLAISDPNGYVIGTNVAIARRINMPVADFERCLAELMKPDPHSNSLDEEGRRVVASDGERGYRLVNYLIYREMKSAVGKREYMREYMRKRRACVNRVNPNVNPCKTTLTDVTHAEEEATATGKADPPNPQRGKRAPAPIVSDDEWMASLESDSTYSGINIRTEFGKMTRWCETAKRKPSRRTFINWLNRIDKPITTNGHHSENFV